MPSVPDTPDDPRDPGFLNQPPKGGLYGTLSPAPAGLNDGIRATIGNYQWTTVQDDRTAKPTEIKYAFPTAAAEYGANYDYPKVMDGDVVLRTVNVFESLTDLQKDAVRKSFNLVTWYTGVTFTRVDSPSDVDASIRIVNYGESGSEAWFPTGSDYTNRTSGDTFLGTNGKFGVGVTNYFGTDSFATIMHELGHALGLKHGHEASPNGALASNRDDSEFSVMTYRSFFGATIGNTIIPAVNGSAPQSYMMFDIGALQTYYGASLAKVGSTATYTWDSTTGQQKIDGVTAPDIGTTDTNKIFSTVWTRGATATYDLSNFSEDQVDDMRPGAWMKFSSAQLADLNNSSPGTNIAQGNIYNSLLYEGNTASEISNLKTGTGNDTVNGNDLANRIETGDGNDYMRGWGGVDLLFGGAGNDELVGESGADTLTGGDGNDFYIVSDSSVTIVEQTGEGTDRALITVNNYTVGANVEEAYAGNGVTTITGNDTGIAMFARNGQALTLNGGTGNDSLYGADQGDPLNGGDGNDYLRGRAGVDAVNGGAGDDTLVGEFGADTLTGGTGDDLYVVSDSGVTIVEQANQGSDSAIVLVNNYTIGANVELAYVGAGVAAITASNTGMAIFARDGQALTINGGTGNDSLYGADQADTLNGGDGDDYLRGRAGIDALNGGAGNDTLVGEFGADVLTGGTGNDQYIVSDSSVTIVEQANEGHDYAVVMVDNYTIGANVEVGYVGAGVTTLNGNNTGMAIYARAGQALTINGGSGNDQLTGADQADTLKGGTGNDTMDGGAGNDTYSFARGDGNDRMATSNATGSDTVSFASGVAHDQLWFSQSSNDLLISVIGESQALTVADWYASSTNRFTQIVAGDGFSATAAAVNLLVQAMAGLSQPGLGQLTLPTETATTLAPTLAANWQSS